MGIAPEPPARHRAGVAGHLVGFASQARDLADAHGHFLHRGGHVGGGFVLSGRALCHRLGRLAQRGSRVGGLAHAGLHRADDGVEAIVTALAAPIGAHLAPQTARFERLLDRQGDIVKVERLVQIVICAVFHRFDGVLDRRECRHQDDRRVR